MSGIVLKGKGKKKYAIQVIEITVVSAMKGSRARTFALENPREDPDEQVLLADFYPNLVAASKGDIPSPDEFLEMSPIEAGRWYDEVEKMNPGTFVAPEKATTPEEELEKKES